MANVLRARRFLANLLGGVLLLGLAACGEEPAEAPAQRDGNAAPAKPELPVSGPASLAPLIGRWATRAEHCAASSPEPGALIAITETGFTSGNAGCRFASVARRGPRYDILSNCSSEGSGPVPNETLVFVFTSTSAFEWRTPDGAVQFAYLRCP